MFDNSPLSGISLRIRGIKQKAEFMPLSKQRQLEYQRNRRLRGRTCEGCGEEPAELHYKASTETRTIVLCIGCVEKLTASEVHRVWTDGYVYTEYEVIRHNGHCGRMPTDRLPRGHPWRWCKVCLPTAKPRHGMRT